MRRRDSVQLSENSALVVYATMLIAIFFVFTFSGSVFADGKKTIYVSFDFEGKDFSEVRPDTLDAISTRIAEQFVTAVNAKYGFLNWVNANPPDCEPASPNCEPAPAWKIKLVLVAHKKTIRGKSKISTSGKLIHEGSLPDGSTELYSGNLYEEGGYIPLLDPDQLEYDISHKLELELETILETSKVKDFLNKIPLVDKVYIDEANEFVIIPVKYRDLQSDTKTTLTVTFFLESGVSKGDMTLNPFEIKVQGDYPDNGLVKGYVTQVRYPGVSGVGESFWHPSFQTIIPSEKETKVYMAVYSPQVFVGVESNGATDIIE